VALPASAAERHAVAPLLLSTDISCPPGAQQQTHCTGVRAAGDGTGGQTDRRTPDRYTDPYAHTMPRQYQQSLLLPVQTAVYPRQR